jgi:hypothetical protein
MRRCHCSPPPSHKRPVRQPLIRPNHDALL